MKSLAARGPARRSTISVISLLEPFQTVLLLHVDGDPSATLSERALGLRTRDCVKLVQADCRNQIRPNRNSRVS